MPDTKQYLYHMVPLDMEGSVLYPLNVLKEMNRELYLFKIKKYEGREEVMKQIIPFFNCLWNDVIHLTAVNPIELKKALIESGVNSQPMKFYKIDPNLLDPENTIIYLYKSNELTADNFTSFNTLDLEEYSQISEKTKDYYKERIKSGVNPLLYAWVPHILYKGNIDVSSLPIVEV